MHTLRGIKQYSNRVQAAVGPARAAVFFKHCVTPAPEQQSSPAHPPRPHTNSKSGSSPLSSCLALFSSNSFAFCHSMTDSSLKCSTLPAPPPCTLFIISTLVAREGFWSPASENTILSHRLQRALRPAVCIPTGSKADRRIKWLLFMFLVKNTDRKKTEKKWYFRWPSKANVPVRNGIKGQWRFFALLQCFLVVLLSEVFFSIFSLWYIKHKRLSDYNCGLEIMWPVVKAYATQKQPSGPLRELNTQERMKESLDQSLNVTFSELV